MSVSHPQNTASYAQENYSNTLAQVISYESMGTTWKIHIWSSMSEQAYSHIAQTIMSASYAFDAAYSRFSQDSIVSQIEKNGPGTYFFGTDGVAMLRIYKELHNISYSNLNPLIGQTISDLGYDAQYSLSPKQIIRQTPNFDTVLHIIDDEHIEVTQSVLIDLGALGKGYFVDKIVQILRQQGYNKFLVDGSGDFFHADSANGAIDIGLAHPNNENEVIGVYPLKNGALCGSGVNKRSWREYHHVINPKTNAPQKGVLATWVNAHNTALADGLASCLFFTEMQTKEEIDHSPLGVYMAKNRIEWCVITNSLTPLCSNNFQQILFK